ncbi:MAG: hypothetical protein ACI4EV_07365 [Lachnospiraceae bacterium]
MNQINQRYLPILKKNETHCEVYEECLKRLNLDSDLYLSVMAPVMVEFVKWVLFQAVADGKKRLYFLARDGWQMYLAAKKLADFYGLDMDCRYINVSRYSMRVPEYHLLGRKCVDRICVGGIDVTFEKIMARAGISHGQALAVAAQCGYDKKFSEVISYQEIMDLKKVLADSTEFLDYVYEQSELAYSEAIGYLKQEGIFDDVSFAVVDSGWIGTLAESVKNLGKSVLTPDKAEKFKIDGYYFGLYDLPGNGDKSSYKSFYFGKRDNIKRKVYFSNSLFEAIFSAPEGMTHHYELHDGRYIPVTAMAHNSNCNRIRGYGQKLEIYLQCFTDKADVNDTLPDMRMVEKLLFKFMAKPSDAEIKEFGDIMFCDDVLENSLQKVSADLSYEEIKKQRFMSKMMMAFGIKKGVIHESAWLEGSIVKNGNAVKSGLRHAAFCKYIVYIRKLLK